ncbi:MAG: 30S ribosomal protein S2 [Patescibacteria group bacterium]|nr:30S ribosomal protein S2 [Patescibacteria group bacterium]
MLKSASDNNQGELVKQLFATGAHFGYTRARNHPSMRESIYCYKGGAALIDLERTASDLEKASSYLTGLAMEGKKILLVGAKVEAGAATERVAESLDMPYVTSRWLGGTFTNFSHMKTRIDRLTELKEQKEKGELDVYTKKERLLIDREIARLERYLSGLVGLVELPAAVIVTDSRAEAIVVAEARKTGVKVISLSNTDCDLTGIDYPIAVNDSSAKAIRLILERLADAYRRGRESAKIAAETVAKEAAAAPTPAPISKPAAA